VIVRNNGNLIQTLRAALTCVAVLVAGSAALPAAAATPEKVQTWTAWGGTVGVRWNRELAADLGLTLGTASARHARLSEREHEVFDLRQVGSLEFDVRNGSLRGFVGGALQARGGHAIDTPSGRIDLTDFRLVPRAGDPLILDIVGSDGKAWFYADRLMYELIESGQRLAVRTMDVRITPELARRLGQPAVAGWAIADMQMTTEVLRQGSGGSQPQPLAVFKWHGTPAPDGVSSYLADLFMTNFTVQYSRCNGCTGDGGAGVAVFTPSSTLRNNVNNGALSPTVANDPLGTSTALWAADIPWWQKFSGSNAPYNNDQHPYLIWNLYRLNPDGTMDQIGRSGVKHAFLTVNTACIENPGNSHILGLGCGDTYGTGNNDSSNDLGPRSEIIPFSNLWGRCGSIYDTNCDGVANASGNGVYDQRLTVRESQFSGAPRAGSTYLFESWYLAREDINILNSMATKRVTFTRSGSVWAVGGNDQYRLGPAIDRWVDPAAPGPNASSSDVSTPEGRFKVAAKATDLGGGRWRYDYAAMNLDFSRARTEGASPNLRVVSNLGFDNFSVPVGSATITDLVFGDGDLDASNDWVSSIRDGRVYWTSSTRGNALNWGTMFRFSFITNQAPSTATVTMHIAADNTRQTVAANGVVVPTSANPVSASAAARPAR